METAIAMSTKREKYIATIKELRTKNFRNGLPFLILSDNLPDGQVYREFSDGHIEVQEVYSVGSKINSKTVKILSIRSLKW